MKHYFEKGKWYKVLLNGKHYHLFKFNKLIGNGEKVDVSEGFYDFSDNAWRVAISFNLDSLTSFEEKSLNEIQEYLPENHVDKLPKEVLLTRVL